MRNLAGATGATPIDVVENVKPVTHDTTDKSTPLQLIGFAAVLGVCLLIGLAMSWTHTPREQAALPVHITSTGTLAEINDAPPRSVAGQSTTHQSSKPMTDVPAVRGAQLNLNMASASELDALPRIGQVLAERIVAWRTEHRGFADIHELLEIRGIGPSIFSRLAMLLTIK